MKDIVIRIPSKEVETYSEKMYGFTLRQWVGIILILVTCVPLSIWTQLQGTMQSSFIFNVVIGGTIACVCFVKINELPFEKIFPYIKRSFVQYANVLGSQTEREATIFRLLSMDKKYRKGKAKVENIKKNTPEYMWTNQQRSEIYNFEVFEQRLIQSIAYMVDQDHIPTKKEVKRMARQCQ